MGQDVFVHPAREETVVALASRAGAKIAAESNTLSVTTVQEAVDAVLAGQPPAAEQTPSIGCNIKWKAGSEPDYFNPAGVS